MYVGWFGISDKRKTVDFDIRSVIGRAHRYTTESDFFFRKRYHNNFQRGHRTRQLFRVIHRG